MKRIHLILLGLVVINLTAEIAGAADPYKMVIVSEPGARSRAEDFVKLAKKTPPFSRMGSQLVFEIVDGDPAQLDCKQGEVIRRLITCNVDYAIQLAAKHSANKVLIATDSASGGSGGTVGVAGAGYPASTLLHELLHTYGLGDEYEYSSNEANSYCAVEFPFANLARFAPRPSYSSDGEAKRIHQPDIPWFGSIEASTKITSGSSLGSPAPSFFNQLFSSSDALKEKAALYPGGDCIQVKPTWKPYMGETIMNSFRHPVIPDVHAKAIVLAMSSERGEKIELLPAPPQDQKSTQVYEGLDKKFDAESRRTTDRPSSLRQDTTPAR